MWSVFFRCEESVKGVPRGTRVLEDQLGRTDAGRWQIADCYTVASSAAHRVAIGDFRARFAAELCSWRVLQPRLRAHLKMSADTVCRTKERALDPLLVPALLALATPPICWLKSAAASDVLAQHPRAGC